MKTKLLALVLACVMMLSIVPATVFAAEGEHEHACPGKGKDHNLELCPDATEVEVVPTQCGEWGYTIYQCHGCGDYFADKFNKVEGNHSWKVTAEAVPDTCTGVGKTLLETCEVCNKATRGGEIVDKIKDHDWKETGRDGDCLTGGFVYEKCAICGEERKTPLGGTGNGHDWSEPPVIKLEPTCETKGIAVYTCKCGATKEVAINVIHDHKLVEHKAVAATCTTAGNNAYWQCSVCDACFEDANGTTEYTKDKDGNYVDIVIPAHGHDLTGEPKEKMPATCSEAGWMIVHCPDCDTDVKVELKATGHTFEDEKPYKIEATCTSWGFDVYACTVCGYVKRTNAVAPLGHSIFACPKVGEKDHVCAAACNVGINQVTTPANCTTAGLKTWNCVRCGELLKEEIPATGHKVTTVNVAATCAKFAYTYSYCTNANCPLDAVSAFVKDSVEYDVTVKGAAVKLINDYKVGDKLDPSNHTIKDGVINAPTCTTAGNAVGYCVDCNEYSTKVLPATGHIYDDEAGYIGVQQSCTTDEEMWYDCTVCGNIKKVKTENTKTGHKFPETGIVIAPTCQADGFTLFVCETCGEQEKRDVVKYTPRSEYTAEQAEAEHSNPSYVKEFRAPDCVTIGLNLHYCAACDQFILVVIDGTGKGHEMPDNHPVEEPTCTEKGKIPAYTCTVCGAEVAEEILEALGHTEVADKAVAPTCTETGLTAGSHCGVCGEVLVKQETVKELGHDFKVIPEVPATCTEAGVTETKICQRDCCILNKEGDRYTEGGDPIPALGHDIKITGRTVSCTLFGYYHYDCQRDDCDLEYIDNYKAALGHDWELDKDASYGPTCTVDGADIYTCKNSKTCAKTDTVPALGHENKAGEAIVDDCLDTVEDRVCIRCCVDKDGKPVSEIGKSHNAPITLSIDANCTEYGYTIDFCTNCKVSYNRQQNDYATPLGHDLTDWADVPGKEATYTKDGVQYRECKRNGCDFYEERVSTKVGIQYSLEIDNALVNGEAITDGSLIAVKVKLDSAKVDVWGLKFDLYYSSSAVEYVSAEFLSENFITSPMANDNGNYVSVIASAPNAEDKTTQNITIEGEEDFVVLYFRVINANAWMSNFIVHNCESIMTMPGDEDPVTIETAGCDVIFNIAKFMDVNADGDVNLADALIVYKMITGEVESEYDSTVDVDRNGEVNLADFTAIYEYLVGAKTYEEMVGRSA